MKRTFLYCRKSDEAFANGLFAIFVIAHLNNQQRRRFETSEKSTEN
ncbi:hypothetical protein [Salmonella phage SD-1_S14]|nr:hypothetical protein [Salmonella phage SD-2_S15]WPK18874.1 hypothetical protein [Salmonella phage SD-6_S16]WPK19541.1 hypothetical protein [Salmonella phage SD-1_S14]WPK20568.1 hypothetical protein [Salmonella phage SD-15_S21]